MYTYILNNIVYTNTSNSIPFYIQGVPEACVSVKRLLNTKLFPYNIRIILPPFLVAREYFFFFFFLVNFPVNQRIVFSELKILSALLKKRV